jgi:hypothetical protein
MGNTTLVTIYRTAYGAPVIWRNLYSYNVAYGAHVIWRNLYNVAYRNTSFGTIHRT